MNQRHILFIIDGLPGGGAENVTPGWLMVFISKGYIKSLLSLQINWRMNYLILLTILLIMMNTGGIFLGN